MAIAFTNISWWLWSGKQQEEPKISNGNSLNPSSESGLWESDTLKFPLVRRGNVGSSTRRVKRKWHSREERKIEKQYDIVLVPSDGGCFSGSESDDSDWSIGWLEPHAPAFQNNDDSDDSFAVLVPCYGRGGGDLAEHPKDKFFDTIGNIPDLYAAGLLWEVMIIINHLLPYASLKQEIHGAVAFFSAEHLMQKVPVFLDVCLLCCLFCGLVMVDNLSGVSAIDYREKIYI